MSHSDGIGWLLGQPAAIISKYIYSNSAQRVPEYVKNILLVIWGVIISPSVTVCFLSGCQFRSLVQCLYFQNVHGSPRLLPELGV